MAEFHYDDATGITVLNDTNVPSGEVFSALHDQQPELAAMVRWSNDTRMPTSRRGGLFERDRYVTPQWTWDQMKVAYHAAEADDVVSGILESTEAQAFGKISIDTDDEDQADVWNQIMDDLDLEGRLREMWREDFIVSQFYVATWWGTRSYTVGGKSDAGTKRKKKFRDLQVPIGMTILDPLKIVPVGNLMFNKESLAYCADSSQEYDLIKAVIDGNGKEDDLIKQLMIQPYTPDEVERRMLSDDGINPGRLFSLNPANVWRHADTKSQYMRFSTVRMRGIFELLDLKSQLRAMDRAHLLGGTNFIVLIKKGDKDRPARPAEITALQANVRNLSRTPVIVGDDRLDIEIITPNTDTTLSPERYNGLDARITARLYQMFMTGNYSAGAKGDDSIKLAKMVARGLESRRHNIAKTVTKRVLKPAYKMNEAFTEVPVLRFHPKRIALDFDPTYANFILDLLDRGHISRESGLEEVDYDQQVELRRRKLEKKFDADFAARVAPGQSNLDPKSGGRREGGVKNGGGAAPGSGQGQEPVDPSNTSK